MTFPILSEDELKGFQMWARETRDLHTKRLDLEASLGRRTSELAKEDPACQDLERQIGDLKAVIEEKWEEHMSPLELKRKDNDA